MRSLRTASPETPHWCGDSGLTPDALLGLPTSSNHLSRKTWVRRLRPGGAETAAVRKLRGPSGPTPHAHLVVPTYWAIRNRKQGAETPACGCGDSGGAETPAQLRTNSAPASGAADTSDREAIFKEGRRLRPTGAETPALAWYFQCFDAKNDSCNT